MKPRKSKHRPKRRYTGDPSHWRKGFNRKWKTMVKRALRDDPEGVIPNQRGMQLGYYW